jgi:ribosomal-protein-alanine N-acetyltransferase
MVRIDTMGEDDVVAVASIDGATPMSEQQLADELKRPWARVWVARDPSDERGVAAFLVAWQVADELHVLNVATRPERRRRGLARALMDHAVRYARANHDKHILLEVRRSNLGAIALYRAIGFFAMGVRARYYPDDEDAIEMVLAFDPDTGAVVPQADQVRLHG